MKKNTLYTINKYNRRFLIPDANYFDTGGNVGDATKLVGNTNASDWMKAYNIPSLSDGGLNLDMINNFKNQTNAFGLSKMQNPFSKANILGGPKAMFNTGIGAGVLGAAGTAVGGLAYRGLSGGLNSGVGSGINKIGGTVGGIVSQFNPVLGSIISAGSGILGGGVNALFGTSVDEKKLAAAKAGTAAYNNFVSNAASFDAVRGPIAQANVQDAYKSGLFRGSWADDRNLAQREAREDAKLFAYNAVNNNVHNLATDQIANALSRSFAYGGNIATPNAVGIMQQNKYFDAINNRTNALTKTPNTLPKPNSFADGGYMMQFFDNFQKDPIAAAVQYQRGLQLEAERREQEAIEAEKERAFVDLQTQLQNLQMQNAGLQSSINTMQSMQNPGYNIAPDQIPQFIKSRQEAIANTPVSSYSPSSAASFTPRKIKGNTKNWDYIENELRKTGKFNDIQIEGIKLNLERESGANPDLVGDDGKAYGLAQWHGDRQPKDRSLEGQTKFFIDSITRFDPNHWIGEDNYKRFYSARTPEEAHYYLANGYERPAAKILKKVKEASDMSLKSNKFAKGGSLGNGSNFSNGLLEINNGGTHEENPLGGVPMGVDSQGTPNLVREGETVYQFPDGNKEVFAADDLPVEDSVFEALGLDNMLKRYKGKNKKNKSKRPTFADISKYMAKESEQRPNDILSRESLTANLARLAEYQKAARMKKQAEEMKNSMGGQAPINLDEQQPANSFAYAGTMDVGPYSDYYHGIGIRNPWDLYTVDWDDVGKKTQPAQWNPFPNILNPEYKVPAQRFTDTQRLMYDHQQKTGNTDFVGAITPIKPVPKPSEIKPEEILATKPARNKFNPYMYPTWMRYAPVFGAGALTLTDLLGITNKPDYSHLRGLEAAVNRAGYTPDIGYKPIGDYKKYTPYDVTFGLNRLAGGSRATSGMIANSAAPIGTKMAGQLANTANYLKSTGDMYRSALEYNDAKDSEARKFNRETNMANSEMDMKAQIANAENTQLARRYHIAALSDLARMKLAIDQGSDQAKAINLSNFLTSLGNVGRENFAMNQLNSAAPAHNMYMGNLSGGVYHYDMPWLEDGFNWDDYEVAKDPATGNITLKRKKR